MLKINRVSLNYDTFVLILDGDNGISWSQEMLRISLNYDTFALILDADNGIINVHRRDGSNRFQFNKEPAYVLDYNLQSQLGVLVDYIVDRGMTVEGFTHLDVKGYISSDNMLVIEGVV